MHKNNMIKNSKGITLIALVITIIILIILAGVSINILFDSDGLIEKAKEARENNFRAVAKEEIELALASLMIENQGEKIKEADLLDEEKGLYSKNSNIILNTDNPWTGTYTDGKMQVNFTIDSTSYKVTLESEITDSEIILDYHIIYDTDGGQNAPENQTKSNLTISTQKPTRNYDVFLGWSTTKGSKQVEYTGGEKYTGKDKITLYAVWLEGLEYLESDGYHYIDTGFCPNQDTSIEFVASTSDDTKNEIQQIDRAWFGSREIQKTNAFVLWNTDNKFVNYYNTSEKTISNVNISLDQKYTIYMNKNIFNINGTKYLEHTYANFTSPLPLTLFGVMTSVKTDYNEPQKIDLRMSKLKLYSCKIWDNDELIRYYIPVKDFNGVECLYDYQNKEFYYFKDCITEIEYIQSTGVQYIDTGIYPNQDTSIEFVAEKTELEEGVTRAWFGSRNGYAEKSKAYILWETNNNFIQYYNASQNTISDLTLTANKKYTIYMNKNILNIDGIQYANPTYSSFSSPSTLTLFGAKTYISTSANSENSIDSRMAKLKLYSCKIWQNGILARDYIPIKDSSGRPCLFDKVTRRLFYNKGTSNDFIASEN